MYMGKSVGVVVPCHNEETNIGAVIETLPDFVDRVIVVDDLSTDRTAEIVSEWARRQPGRVELIRHEKNGGVGASTVTGYRRAIEEKLDVTVVVNGDAQMDPDDMPHLVEPVASGAVGYAKGNRLFTGDAWNVIPKVRYLGNSALSLMTKIVSGYWHIADSQTGYTAIGLEALKGIRLEHLYPRYGFPNDMLIALNVSDVKVRDVPIRPVYGVGERSGIRLWKVIPTISWMLFRRFWWRMTQKYIIRNTHPLVLFYVFGLFLGLAGLALGIYEIWGRIRTGQAAAASFMLAALLMISGLQLVLFAMWFDMENNRDLV
jgi:glycosyltransferase involved in cell wall biosynthesis